MQNVKTYSGIDIPKPTYGPKPGTHCKYPLLTMAVGESFFVPQKITKSICSLVKYHQARTGRKFVTRSMPHPETGEAAFGVFRVA